MGSLIFGNWKVIIVGLAAFAIASSIFMFWQHYENLVDSNAEFKKQVGQLEVSLQTQTKTIEAQEEAISEFVTAQEQFKKDMEIIRNERLLAQEETKRLQKLFAKHDLNNLLQKKPDTIERLINAGSNRTFRLLECATGVEHKDCPN